MEAEVNALAQPDEELLMYQQQKSLPRLSLTGIREDDQHELIMDDVDLCDSPDHVENQYGMMQAGGEDKIKIKLIKAGSLDLDGNPHGTDGSAATLQQDLATANEEEQKQQT